MLVRLWVACQSALQAALSAFKFQVAAISQVWDALYGLSALVWTGCLVGMDWLQFVSCLPLLCCVAAHICAVDWGSQAQGLVGISMLLPAQHCSAAHFCWGAATLCSSSSGTSVFSKGRRQCCGCTKAAVALLLSSLIGWYLSSSGNAD